MAETLAVALRAELAEVRDTGVTSVRRQYIWDSQGKKILVGDIRECWEKIERVKLEKKVEEERADKEQLSRESRTAERRLEEVKKPFQKPFQSRPAGG